MSIISINASMLPLLLLLLTISSSSLTIKPSYTFIGDRILHLKTLSSAGESISPYTSPYTSPRTSSHTIPHTIIDVLIPQSPSAYKTLLDLTFDEFVDEFVDEVVDANVDENIDAVIDYKIDAVFDSKIDPIIDPKIQDFMNGCKMECRLEKDKEGIWVRREGEEEEEVGSTVTSILNLLNSPPPSSSSSSSELVPWIMITPSLSHPTTHPILPVPRATIHTLNLLHPGSGVIVHKPNPHHTTADKQRMYYCHKRTETKRVFPGMFDMMIGGVSCCEGNGATENGRNTAVREIGEELGLRRSDNLSGILFRCGVATGYNRCVVSFYEYRVEEGESIVIQEEEVKWGGWVEEDVVIEGVENDTSPNVVAKFQDLIGGEERVERVEWVPDGLIVWEKFRNYERINGRTREKIILNP